MSNLPHTFDPDAPAQPGTGIFGLPFTRDDAAIVLIPVPFDATTSYSAGAAQGPRIILDASAQVDLYDHQFGRIYERGIFMEDIPEDILELSAHTRTLTGPIIERGGATPEDAHAVAQIDKAGDRIRKYTHERTIAALRDGKMPAIIGGEHSVPLGAFDAIAEYLEDQRFSILHIDAHLDLRNAFDGFRYSHASIMHNALADIPAIERLVSVAIRDYAEGERAAADEAGDRVIVHYDLDLHRQLDEGAAWSELCERIVRQLTDRVYISFDIDALDPALCPHTGTPVPGGLSFNHAARLLEILARSGKRIIGFDLVEVAPNPANEDDEWDANVGARILYKLCGTTLTANR